MPMKFTARFPKFHKITTREMREVAEIGLRDLEQTVPVDTGKLKRGITYRITSRAIEYFIKGKRNNEVAEYLTEGTKDHFVRPKRKNGVLSWISAGGQRIYSKGHMVSGIRKGYWKFRIRAKAVSKMTSRLNQFIKAK